MTECPDCTRVETPRRHRIMAAAASWVVDFVFPPSPVAHAGAAMAASMRAMTGYREPTWYEKHRDRWVETGDVRELERMARHVDSA